MQNIDIINVKDNLAAINKVTDKHSTNVLLATLRVVGEESKTTRLEVKIRTSEGQNGHLNVLVIPKRETKNKTC